MGPLCNTFRPQPNGMPGPRSRSFPRQKSAIVFPLRPSYFPTPVSFTGTLFRRGYLRVLLPVTVEYISGHVFVRPSSLSYAFLVLLEQYKKHPVTVSSPIVPSSPARRTVHVRMETEDAKQRKREVEEAERAKHRKEEEEGTRKDEGCRGREEAWRVLVHSCSTPPDSTWARARRPRTTRNVWRAMCAGPVHAV